MSTYDADKAVRLEEAAPASRRAAAPAAPVQTAAPAGGLVGLGAKAAPAAAAPAGGLVGLGAKAAPAAAAPAGGLVGLGAKAAPAASAPAGGLVGLGAKAAPAASAPAGGIVGLGTKAAPAASAPAGGIVGLGAKPAASAGLTGLGASAAAATTPAPVPAPRKSGIAIDITAAERIQKLLSGRGTPEAGLRIRVRGGGCTGLTYDMEFADEARDKDRVFEDHQVKIFVDPKSYIFLIGTVLTYSAGLMESGFKLENPNAKKSCGCGDSFSV